MKKFYRSLTLIVAINVGGYIVGTIACISANYIGVTASTQWYLISSMTIYGNFGIAAIVPIVCINRYCEVNWVVLDRLPELRPKTVFSSN